MSFLPSILESCHEGLDPEYAQQKKACQVGIQTFKLIAAATLVYSAVSTVFALSSPFSFPIIFVTLPLCYISYNSYQMAENLHQIINNPKQYQYGWGTIPEFNHTKIAHKLKENTILMDWLLLENVVKDAIVK